MRERKGNYTRFIWVKYLRAKNSYNFVSTRKIEPFDGVLITWKY